MNTPRVEPMSRTMAARTIKHYLCAGCWSALIAKPDERNGELDIVICPNCETPGYISKKFVKRSESKSIETAVEARDNLRGALPFLDPHAQKTTKQLITDLFGG